MKWSEVSFPSFLTESHQESIEETGEWTAGARKDMCVVDNWEPEDSSPFPTSVTSSHVIIIQILHFLRLSLFI